MTPKRFIAGAVCPECKEQDSLYIETIDQTRYRACVSCGFREQMRFENLPREPDTRVNRGSDETKVQVVRLLDSKPR